MKNQINISSLLTQFELISDHESQAILGGVDLDALFAQIFDFSAANLNPAVIAMFKKQVTDLASTTVGSNILDGLLAAGHKIYVTNDMPQSSYATGEYEGTANKLNLGALSTDTVKNYLNAQSFSVIAHELYHAYQDNVLFKNIVSPEYIAYSKDAKSEIDAGIFSYMATIQYDISHNLSLDDDNSHSRMSFNLTANGTTSAVLLFNQAWDNMFLNGDFSLENYNKLVENFKDGSSYKIKMDRINTLQNLDDTFIDNLFLDGFSNDVKLFKAMYEQTGLTPNQLLQQDPTLRPTGNGGDNPSESNDSSYNNGNDGYGDYGSNNGSGPVYSNGSFYFGYPDTGYYGGGGGWEDSSKTGYRWWNGPGSSYLDSSSW